MENPFAQRGDRRRSLAFGFEEGVEGLLFGGVGSHSAAVGVAALHLRESILDDGGEVAGGRLVLRGVVVGVDGEQGAGGAELLEHGAQGVGVPTRAALPSVGLRGLGGGDAAATWFSLDEKERKRPLGE